MCHQSTPDSSQRSPRQICWSAPKLGKLKTINYPNVGIDMGNILTVVAGDVFVDPGEANLSGQSCHEADINIVGVEGGLDSVLVSKVSQSV